MTATMHRRRWLQWGCAHCAALAGLAHAQGDWAPPARFVAPAPSTDEAGLWSMMDREEARLRRSPFRMREEPLQGYLSGIACKLAGDHCPDVRVYAVRMPYFNASMAPNGMMQIWSGLLLRMDDEAQLAAVIGHELGHYLQRHGVEQLRDAKARAAFASLMAGFGLVGLVGQLAALGAGYSFSRDQEREADRISIVLLRNAGYDPREAARVWADLLDELKANPGADPSSDSILFKTHPPSDERQRELQRLAADGSGFRGEREYAAVIAPLRFSLLEDELKRGRMAESLVLLNRLLARAPDDAVLLYFRGETQRRRDAPGDAAAALADFEAAVRTGQEPAVTYRSLGTLYRAMNQPDLARDAWKRYLQAAPQAPDAALIQQTLEDLP